MKRAYKLFGILMAVVLLVFVITACQQTNIQESIAEAEVPRDMKIDPTFDLEDISDFEPIEFPPVVEDLPTFEPIELPEEEAQVSYEPEEETQKAAPQQIDYVLNKNSKKFHEIDCYSVDQMKESNKEYYTGDRDTVIARGYKPCKNCNP